MLRKVYHQIIDLKGRAIAGQTVIFKLLNTGSTATQTVLKSSYQTTSDENGAIALDLWVNSESQNEACYHVCLPDGNGFNFQIPAGDAPISLSALKQAGISWDNPDFLPTVEYFKKNPTQITANATLEKSTSHIQAIAQTEWIVTHNLDKYPAVTILDNLGNEVEGAVDYTDKNSLTIRLSPAMTGSAHLN